MAYWESYNGSTDGPDSVIPILPYPTPKSDMWLARVTSDIVVLLQINETQIMGVGAYINLTSNIINWNPNPFYLSLIGNGAIGVKALFMGDGTGLVAWLEPEQGKYVLKGAPVVWNSYNGLYVAGNTIRMSSLGYYLNGNDGDIINSPILDPTNSKYIGESSFVMGHLNTSPRSFVIVETNQNGIYTSNWTLTTGLSIVKLPATPIHLSNNNGGVLGGYEFGTYTLMTYEPSHKNIYTTNMGPSYGTTNTTSFTPIDPLVPGNKKVTQLYQKRAHTLPTDPSGLYNYGQFVSERRPSNAIVKQAIPNNEDKFLMLTSHRAVYQKYTEYYEENDLPLGETKFKIQYQLARDTSIDIYQSYYVPSPSLTLAYSKFPVLDSAMGNIPLPLRRNAFSGRIGTSNQSMASINGLLWAFTYRTDQDGALYPITKRGTSIWFNIGDHYRFISEQYIPGPPNVPNAEDESQNPYELNRIITLDSEHLLLIYWVMDDTSRTGSPVRELRSRILWSGE